MGEGRGPFWADPWQTDKGDKRMGGGGGVWEGGQGVEKTQT